MKEKPTAHTFLLRFLMTISCAWALCAAPASASAADPEAAAKEVNRQMALALCDSLQKHQGQLSPELEKLVESCPQARPVHWLPFLGFTGRQVAWGVCLLLVVIVIQTTGKKGHVAWLEEAGRVGGSLVFVLASTVALSNTWNLLASTEPVQARGKYSHSQGVLDAERSPGNYAFLVLLQLCCVPAGLVIAYRNYTNRDGL